ncbi:hypothetical protein SAMN06265373_10468 [Shimia sagamensis]|uniref:Uncharacterized protein n=1 Tax=Shimia sagamensis TaxID=1566352 RepID=A0ABY1NZX2_9RHOB|nr:hypothetical protein SAMN06265373_10468 [Shimia sagamensis]
MGWLRHPLVVTNCQWVRATKKAPRFWGALTASKEVLALISRPDCAVSSPGPHQAKNYRAFDAVDTL